MSVIHAPREPEIGLRNILFLVVVCAAFLAFLFRLWYLQVVASDELAARAHAFRMTKVETLAPRGLIVDRDGRSIAGVRSEIVLTAIPGIVGKQPWILDKVASILGAPVEPLREKLDAAAWRPFLPAPIFVGVPILAAARIAESGDDLPGIGVEPLPMRFYASTSLLTHVLGYVWTPNDRDMDRLREAGIRAADYVGKEGIERAYEALLMGKPGTETIEVDNRRRPRRVTARDSAVPGSKLFLTVDLRLQELASALLSERRGAVVAIEPSTGEVLCLSSSPSYDAGIFIGGLSKSDWSRLREDPGHPLINRAVSSRYAAGSTFKLITSLAAFKAGVFEPYGAVFCPGYFKVGKKTVKCLGSHGSITFERALARSCNTFFASWGTRAGRDALVGAATDAGLGSRTGVDLPAESRGLIPTDEWLASLKTPKTWYEGDTVNMSLGQGETAVTPIQMACLASLVANAGVSYRPHLVRAIEEPTANAATRFVEPEVMARIDATPEFWSGLRSAMLQVVESGTARGSAKIPGLIWAGKTGSAEHRRAELTHSWFVGFAPFANPKIAIAVLVESAGHGSDVAAPIARQLVQRYLAMESNEASAAANRRAASSEAAASSARPIAP